jgi:hypothetical protein
MRIKLDKILIHISLEICMLSKSMLAPGNICRLLNILELVLSLHRGLGFIFSENSIYFIRITFLVFISLHAYTQKTPLLLLLLLLFPIKLANQYLQLLVGLTTFSIMKVTTTDLLHLGVIRPLP